MNKVILLETQLAVAQDRVKALEVAAQKEDKKDDFESSEIKED